jgi:C-terminal peptidase prc
VSAEGIRSLVAALAGSEKDARTRAALEKFGAGIGDSMDDCGPVLRLASAYHPNNPKADPLIAVARSVLHATLLRLDRNSGYDDPATVQDGEAMARTGAGIRLHERTDYDLNRTPKYLRIDGFYEGSPNRSLRELRGARLLSIGGKDLAAIEEASKPTPFTVVEYASFLLNRSERPVEVEILPAAGGERKKLTLRVAGFTESPARVGSFERSGRQIAHLRLSTFENGRAAESFKGAWLRELQKLEKGRMDGAVLDLRGNTGGLRLQERFIAEAFLPPQQRVAIHRTVRPNRDGSKSEAAETLYTSAEPVDDTPLIVLIDRKSASASEAVAAALGDHRRALLVGETTLGKGIGQSRVGLSAILGGESALEGTISVTSSFFFSPSGISHHAVGVKPHVEVVDPVLDAFVKEKGLAVRMADRAAKGEVILPNPGNLKAGGFVPASDLVTDELLAEFQRNPVPKDPACARLPKDEGFREEDDCLLATAVAVMDRWLDARGR